MSTLIATLAATVYLSYAMLMYLRQRTLFFPGIAMKRDFAVGPDVAELVSLPASFGASTAIFLPATKPMRGRARPSSSCMAIRNSPTS